jgi:hypothetical protein
MLALKKKPKATKCSDHCIISLITHIGKTAASILRRRIETKIGDTLGEDQFVLRRGNRTKDATGVLRITPQWTVDIDKVLCVCFIGWLKAFDHANWTKLMNILKETIINRYKRRSISKLCMDQTVKVQLDQGAQKCEERKRS